MSQDFLTRFLAGQREKNQLQTSLFALLERVQATIETTELSHADSIGSTPTLLQHKEKVRPVLPLAASKAIAEAQQAVAKRLADPDAGVPTPPPALTRRQAQNRAENVARAASLTFQRPTEPPMPRMLAVFPDAATVQGETKLSKGAAILWAYLHHLALSVAAERGYQVVAGRVVYHLTLGALAVRLGYAARHLYRLCAELEKAGLIEAGAHAQRVGFKKMFDGCLWAIKMTPTGPAPRIVAEEWRHVWRPDFAEDYAGKTGEVAKMSDLLSQQAQPEKIDKALQRMAAKTGSKNPPLSSSDIFGGGIENAVTDGLRVLMLLHTPQRRAQEVARLASLIVKALGDAGRFRQWCSVIWGLIRAENELRPALEGFILQFQRILTDIHEGAPWKSAGAVLMARWKGTAL